MKIKDIRRTRMRNLEIVGKITGKRPTMVATRRLEKATLEDETGAITLNLWGPQAGQVKVGDLVRVKEAYTKTHEGRLELNTFKDIEVLKRAK